MSKQQEKAVNQVVEMQKSLDTLTVDKINEVKPVETEQIEKINYKKIAQDEGVQYIEPLVKLKPFGTLPEKMA